MVIVCTAGTALVPALLVSWMIGRLILSIASAQGGSPLGDFAQKARARGVSSPAIAWSTRIVRSPKPEVRG